MENRIAVIVLAGGLSRRMGVFKPLLPLDGTPALERVLREIAKIGFAKVTVVTGYRHEKLTPLILSKGASACYNDRYEEGMYSSLLAGVRQLFQNDTESQKPEDPAETPEGFFMVPADCALISSAVYQTMCKAVQAQPDAFAVACFGDKNGHPLYVPKKYVPEILAYSGEKGMKYFTEKYRGEIRRIETGAPEILLDMDDIENYQRMKLVLAEKMTGKTAAWRRIYLIRHGETEQHAEPILLGQTDVPLSIKGMSQARSAGEKLNELAPALPQIYSSDLIRASDTAKAIAAVHQNHPQVQYDQRFREISLGVWDGKPITELRNLYPTEFAERGKDLLHYRIPCGETFIELAERSLAALYETMKKTDGEVAFVTHGGVIRTIAAHLSELPVDEFLSVTFANGCVIPLLYRDDKDTI